MSWRLPEQDEVNEWANKIDPSHEVKVVYSRRRPANDCAAEIWKEQQLIHFNRRATTYYRDEPHEIRSFLLHEIGHLHGTARSAASQELQAQWWWITQAARLGLEKEKCFMLGQLKLWYLKRHREDFMICPEYPRAFLLAKRLKLL